jgi:U3 small nucleolar RNA-associated protein 22
LWQIAQTFVKNQKTIGTVHYAYDHGDFRKPYLVVVPPVENGEDAQLNNKKKNKKRKQESTSTTTTMRKPKFRLCIRLEMESLEWIPPLRLIPNRCNLKLSKEDGKTANDEDSHPIGHNISPMYNHAMLEDAYHSFLPTTSHAKSKLQHSKNDSDSESEEDDDHDEEHYPHWIESVVLAKIWCLQRGLLRAHDGFTTDQLALLILYLYRTKKANARMAPLQVLAALFKTILETPWCSDAYNHAPNPTTADNQDKSNLLRNTPSEAATAATKRPKRAVWVLPLHGRSEEQTIQHSALAKTYAIQTRESPVVGVENPPTLVELYRRVVPGPVFLDPTMRFNYLGRLSPNFIQLVQDEASRSLCCLHGPSPTPSSLTSQPADSTSGTGRVEKPFEALFLSPARFWDRFDLYVKVPLSLFRPKATTNTAKSLWNARLQADLGPFEALVRALTHVLQQALGDRIVSLRLLSTGNGIIDIHHHNPSATAADQKATWRHLDSDEIPYFQIDKKTAASPSRKKSFVSPTGDSNLVLGISSNVDTCHRIVDRGPPAENAEGVQTFLDLWGNKAELRRFKDGAIVQAAIWNTTKNEPTTFIKTSRSSYVRYQNDDVMQGGIVERIISLILHRHFLVESSSDATKSILMSPLRDMASITDGVAIVDTPPQEYNPMFSNPTLAFRGAMKAYEELSSFLKDHSLPSLPVAGSLENKESRLGIPLAIDAVEPLSPCLRYSELFPPLPHPLLGGTDIKGMKKIAGVTGYEPICIQIRFGAFSKWPTDLKAISAAKTAMLIQLAKGIETMQSSSPHDCEGFAGPMSVTPGYLDLGFRGYVFRVKVRADPEIRLLRGLFKPTDEAVSLLQALTKEHIVSAMHHSMMHSITTKHASAGGVIRMASRWVAGHMLSGMIPHEAIELLVAKVYTDRSSSLEPPGSVAAGFLRVLNLIASHDWLR